MKRSGLLVVVLVYVIFIVVILLMGCSSNTTAKSSHVAKKGNIAVSLTDDPAVFSRVNIEITGVLVHYIGLEASAGGWVALDTRKGIYNLLDFQNDLSVLLADAKEIPEGKINRICLQTGNWNSVEVDHRNYPLRFAGNAGDKINIDVDAQIVNGLTTGILFDFDAGKSVKKVGVNDYIVNPVIKVERVQYQ